MRKAFLALGALLFVAGLVVAAEVTVVKYEKGTVTVKEGDKEKTYKIGDKVKIIVVDKEGKETKAEVKFADLEKRLAGKDGKGGAKIDITTKDGEITEVKVKGGAPKKDKN